MYYKDFLKANETANCSTIIVGKNATVTGKVLLGHNEDDEECVVQLHVVPRMKHRPGETITFDDAKAVIPQVEETLGYYWSELRCKGGISWADGYVNECGVAVVSNACRPSNDYYGLPGDDREHYGIGYGIRTLVAQRAKTAREGAIIAGRLIEEYGYTSSRAYAIADKDEAWIVQVVKGHHFAAQRVGDDEVYYMPNHYTIHQIDFNDTEHKKFFWSKNLVENAIENGWYKPAVDGNFDDFDFAAAYQYGTLDKYNLLRAKTAWKMLTGEDHNEDDIRVFSSKATKKYCAADLKRVLSGHHEGMEWNENDGYVHNAHLPIALTVCNDNTMETLVIEFNEDINLLRMLRASPRGCIIPYSPYYPVAMTRVPRGFEWMGWEASLKSHFVVDDEEIEYDPTKAWWTFRTLQFITDFDYAGTHRIIKEGKAELEAGWEKEKDGIEAAYAALKDVDIAAAKELLTAYSCRQAEKSVRWAGHMIRKLGEGKIVKNKEPWQHEIDAYYNKYI